MKCTHPLTLLKRNGTQFKVPCGRCIACRLNRNNQWATRIMLEARNWKYSSFLTLTYDDEHLPLSSVTFQPTLCKRDAQLFFKRLRKEYKFRYFLGGEYGGLFGRPHFHACIFSDDRKNLDRSLIERTWQNGFVRLGELTMASARYIAHYCVDKIGGSAGVEKYVKQGIEPEFALMSRRPGLAQSYVDKYKDMLRNNRFVIIDGKKQSLPRFFANKIFSDDEKNYHFNEHSKEQFEELQSLAVQNGVALSYVGKILKEKDVQRDTNIKRRLSLKKR